MGQQEAATATASAGRIGIKAGTKSMTVAAASHDQKQKQCPEALVATDQRRAAATEMIV
jgi:hypothetical protein